MVQVQKRWSILFKLLTFQFLLPPQLILKKKANKHVKVQVANQHWTWLCENNSEVEKVLGHWKIWELAKMANTFIKGIQKLFLKNTMLWNVKVQHSSTCKLWKKLLFKEDNLVWDIYSFRSQIDFGPYVFWLPTCFM